MIRYNVVVADPPWQFRDRLPGNGRGASKHYSTLTTSDIATFVKTHEPKIEIATDAILFLWRVASIQQEALDVCRAWGFTPKSELVWIKQSSAQSDKLHFGMGHYVRAAHEVCLIATRGKAAGLIESRSVRSVFHAPVGRHSEKPDKFYETVEQLTRGPYVEFFARRRREGWVCYGDQLDV